MEVGMKVWAAGGPDLWQQGTVMKKTRKGDSYELEVTLDKGGSKVYNTSANDEDEIEELKLRNVAGQATIYEGHDVADLTQLTHLHEPAILHSLHMRYNENQIYTYTGPILLAVNPFQKVAQYSDKILNSYKVDGERRCYDPNHQETMAPHVYALADKAYRNMTMPTTEYNLRSQSILVSGESGAGKTETCKIIMKYLAILGNASGDAAHLGEIENQVLQSNPILEAFGNARTVRNDNSSRFGKYIQILFSEAGKLTGATIKTFLLEKIRVVRQTALERNYHVFYMLEGGASAEQRKRWDLKTAKEYHYTNQSGCYDRRDGVSDKEIYAELMHAFKTMGVTEEQRSNCFDVVAAVLALGNISFEEIAGAKDDEAQAQITAASAPYLATAAALLGSEPADIISSLTSRQVTAGLNHQVTIYLTGEQANHARDAMAKAVYAAMFNWVVQRTNLSIDKENASSDGGFNIEKTFIGLLDIFGFEIFKENYFEQFLINYANEVLQQQFNDFVFRQEQEEYRREQIQWTFIQFPDNKDCIALIETKPNGIIPTLDEQCLIGKATDDRYARELYKKCEGNTRFEVSNKMRVDHQFQIKHYAGAVTYSTVGIIEKNRDTLAQEGVDLLLSSTNDFVVIMGEIESAGPGKAVLTKTPLKRTPSTSAMKRTASRRAVRGAAGGRRNTIGAKSLGTQFKDNLGSLIKVVNQTHPHYVRCVKPNDDLVPNRFNHERIAEQLRNAGVLEVVRVARAGFPVRLGVSEFVERYGMLAVLTVEEAYRRTVKENERDQEQFVCKELVKAVLRQINGKPLGDDFAAACRENGLQMGLTKVFFQQKAFNKIEKLRTGIVAGAALKIQTFWRGAHWRRAYLIKKGLLKNSDDSRRQKGLAACKIQRCGRAYNARKRARKALASAKLAQEALFQQRLADQAEMYEAQLAKLTAELTAVRAELTKVRIAHDELAAKPARFVVVAAPLGNSAVAEDIAAQMKALLEKGGVQGSQSLVFSS